MGQVATLLSVLPRGLALTPPEELGEGANNPALGMETIRAEGFVSPPQGEDKCTRTPLGSLVRAANAATIACRTAVRIAATSVADRAVGAGAGGVPPSRRWMESGVSTAAGDGGGRPSH